MMETLKYIAVAALVAIAVEVLIGVGIFLWCWATNCGPEVRAKKRPPRPEGEPRASVFMWGPFGPY